MWASRHRAELDASDAVAQLVQRRRPTHDAHHVWNDQQDSSSDAGFSRQTDLKKREQKKNDASVKKSKVFQEWCSSLMREILTWKANCPEKSYMPQECIRLKVFRTASGLRTRSPVIGQKPPLARVAAMTLALSQVTSMEHSWWRWTRQGLFYFIDYYCRLLVSWNKIWILKDVFLFVSELHSPGSRSRGWRSCLCPLENTAGTKTPSAAAAASLQITNNLHRFKGQNQIFESVRRLYLLLLQVVADGKVSVSRLSLRLETGTQKKKKRIKTQLRLYKNTIL